jgi:hypothetical protein
MTDQQHRNDADTQERRHDDDHAQDLARPEEEGVRSDNAGTTASGSVSGPAPAGGQGGSDVGSGTEVSGNAGANDPTALPPTGQGTAAGGGHGVGSDRMSSGGSGEGVTDAGDDPQTEWLRQEPSNDHA